MPASRRTAGAIRENYVWLNAGHFNSITTVVAALQHEARTIPVVFVLGLDPVESGFVAGLDAKDPGSVENFKRKAAMSPDFGPAFPLLTSALGITKEDH